MKHILIIEDDPKITELLLLHLKDLDFKADTASTGRTGLEKAQKNTYDLIILDLMLPEIEGIEVCRQIRASGFTVPILILTAKSEEIDKVLGLEIGADDYITKPFSIRELLARVKALIRRVEISRTHNINNNQEKIYKIGDLVIDTAKRTAVLKEKPLDLTVKEYELLLLFIEHPGKAYDRQH